ncbi:MAG: hypothetical protein CME31_07490 [Gimesia sp.]|uniref:Uncharacterized protein n=1 Tax=Gimesia maris TaxID=122 RepID=A0A3D3R0J2_9PLAN|nr:hypothetical protein [Gimesia sp.]HCO22259.1 hypothetical protein [Gimesia maris]
MRVLNVMYSKSISMLFIAVALFFNSELRADKPIGINAYSGQWAYVRDPSKTMYVIDNVDGQIVIDSLHKDQIVSNIKLNTHSLSFLRTSSEVNPQTGTPDTINVILIPDGRSNVNMFEVTFMESEELQLTADTKIINLMSRVKNGNDQNKENTVVSKEQSKRALENIYTKQWDFPKLLCTDGKVSLQIVAMKNNAHAIFKYREKKVQVPAKINNNTVTITIDPGKSDDLMQIPVFRDGSKYHLQLIPLYGDKDDLIIKACLIDADRTVCSYLMAPSMTK